MPGKTAGALDLAAGKLHSRRCDVIRGQRYAPLPWRLPVLPTLHRGRVQPIRRCLQASRRIPPRRPDPDLDQSGDRPVYPVALRLKATDCNFMGYSCPR